jgi:archaellum component FlaC
MLYRRRSALHHPLKRRGTTMADIAWSPEDMKLGTQTVNTHGPIAFASGTPTVLPTNPNNPFAKLVAKNDVGQIVQQWLMLQNKCTLGSASSCALRCQLSGIAPYHALLVMGARQVFIRALAPKLSRNGVVVNELLLTEDQCTFEIAGHQFELIRSVKPIAPSPDNSSQNKLKFTLARPLEIGQGRHPTLREKQVQPPAPEPLPPKSVSPKSAPIANPRPAQAIEQGWTFENSQSIESPNGQPQWIADLIQAAMLPLERQLNGIIEPLAAVQNELDRRAKIDRKRRRRPAKLAPTERGGQEPIQAEVNQLQQEATARVAAEQIAAEQLKREHNALNAAFTTQIDVQSQITNFPEPLIVPIISPEVQAQLAHQSETLDNLNARLTELKSNLGSLERIVTENFVTVIDVASAPMLTPAPLSEALDRIHSVTDQLKATVADQLKGLTTQLDDVRSNLGSLHKTVHENLETAAENLASTNELRSAPQPASQEALQRLTDVANQLHHLLQAINARQISTEQSDIAWREQLRAQETSELAWREQMRAQEQAGIAWREQMRAQEESGIAWREQLRGQIGELRETIAETESTILRATEASIEKATQSAQSEILAATEAAVQKASELRSLSVRETCPTPAAVLANGHLNVTTPAARDTATPIQTLEGSIAIAPPVEITPPISPAVAVSDDSSSINAISLGGAATSHISVNTAAVSAAAAVNQAAVSTMPVDALQIDVASEFMRAGFVAHEPTGNADEDFPGSVAVNEIVDEIVSPLSSVTNEPELSAKPLQQYAWNPEPAVSTASEHDIEPTTDYSTSSVNFIEETIEEAPMVEEASASSLPSWWTEDDKTQFKDEASASASSAWNDPANMVGSSPSESSTASTNRIIDYSTGFEPSFTDIDNPATAAWDVAEKYENAPVEPQATASIAEPASLDVIAAVEAVSAKPINDAPVSAEESLELSSLLERFGIVRESISHEAMDSRDDRKPISSRESVETAEEFPAEEVEAFSAPTKPSEAVTVEQIEVVRFQQDTIQLNHEPEPAFELEPLVAVTGQPSSEPSTNSNSEVGEEESIEDYMKRLMARMRGGSLEEEIKPIPAPVANIASPPPQSTDSISSPKLALPSAATERAPLNTTGPFNPEEYVPKALAPEKTRNMAAMRELANNSARSAIQVSARRRYGTAIALKLAIALIGLGVGITLVMINGLNVNIGLIATVASFLVALIWGFDAFSTLKPLLYAAVETLEKAPATPETDDASIV